MDRRSFLRLVPAGGALAVALPSLAACSDDGGGDVAGPATSGTAAPTTTAAPKPFAGYGPLGEPDANGLRLPQGFTSRLLAETGALVAGTDYAWHVSPDGGAVFPQDDGGWIYVSNSETFPGGASMLRFDAAGEVVAARRILGDTSINCAGGKTPWGTWLSCEEVPTGLVYECDPTGETPAVAREAMGRCSHEAAASDPGLEVVYLTEDWPVGGLYRFRPDTWGDLASGTLEVLVGDAGASSGTWVAVPDPSAATTPMNAQVPGTMVFNGGEGADVSDGVLWFTTKGDNRLWRLEPDGDQGATLEVVWDGATADDDVVVANVDNVVIGPGTLPFIAEDGPGLQLVVVGPDGAMWPVTQVVDTPASELTGPAFSPDGTRLYFSSQRSPGRTYEITGPFQPT